MNTVLDTWSSHCFTAFIGNIDHGINEEFISKVFEQFGTIMSLNMPRASDSGLMAGFCFITFEKWESVVLVSDNFDGIILGSKKIRVKPAPKYRP